MTSQIRFYLARLGANYWFYPALFAILAAVLGLVLVSLDRNGWSDFLYDVDWLVPAQPRGAADILTVIAGSMITVASTVFSITIVAVSYASGTYGPRLLTNFLEDRGNQISLATFIATFVYALVVLRSVRLPSESPVGMDDSLPGFAPQLSLLVAYALMAACVAVLVFFLNHVPSSIRINKVLESIGIRLVKAIRDAYPIAEGELPETRQPAEGLPLKARATGYVQVIDFETLEDIAREHDCTLSLRVRTGDFVHRNLALIDVTGGARDDLEEAVQECFTLGPVRTPVQDPEFLIDELVEIGLRALSPGINDPFTAITALHWLGAATSEIGCRDLRKNVCDGKADDCPIIPLPDDFSHFVSRGLGSIRTAVATSPNAAKVMLDTIANAALPIPHADRRELLREQGRKLVEQARQSLAGPDLEYLEEAYDQFRRAFAS